MGKDGATKNEVSDGYVPLNSVLAAHLAQWRAETPFGAEDGRVPLSPAIFVADHLRTAAIATGIEIRKSKQFGLHNLCHSLSNWIVNEAKVQPKTVQGILRHSRIQTTIDSYTQDDADETCAAHGEYLKALVMPTHMPQ